MPDRTTRKIATNANIVGGKRPTPLGIDYCCTNTYPTRIASTDFYPASAGDAEALSFIAARHFFELAADKVATLLQSSAPRYF